MMDTSKSYTLDHGRQGQILLSNYSLSGNGLNNSGSYVLTLNTANNQPSLTPQTNLRNSNNTKVDNTRVTTVTTPPNAGRSRIAGVEITKDGRIRPARLLDLCLQTILRNFRRYTSIVLPDELTLKLIDLLNKRRKLNDETLTPLLHPHLRKIDLINCHNINIPKITRKCPNLKSLSLRGCLTVSDLTLMEIARNSKHLETIDLTYNKKITDRGIQILSENCKELEDIELSWCSRITDLSIEHIAASCPNLRELKLASCRLITGTGIRSLTLSCPSLRKLELRGCTSIVVLPIVSNSLRILNVGNCSSMNNDVLNSIECSSLQELCLSSCPNVNDESIKILLPKCPLLTRLDMSYCNMRDPDIVSNLLIKLNLSGCPNLSIETFSRLAKECPSLKELSLKEVSSTNDEAIDLLTSSKVTTYFARNGHYSYISNLEVIDLARCTQITDKSLSYITSRCPSLKSLDVSWCTELTDKTVKSIIKASKFKTNKLVSVKIFGCAKITSTAIKELSGQIPSLSVSCITCERDWSTLESI